MDKSLFEQVASSLTVKSICSPMGPDIPSDVTAEGLQQFYWEEGDPIDLPSRIVDKKGDVRGVMLSTDFFNASASFADNDTVTEVVAEELPLNQLLSSATTILDAVELFARKEHRYFYVVHVDGIIGVIFYNDLFKPLGRLAFLALALEIEDLALKLCQSAQFRDRCWQSIPDSRKSYAIKIFELRVRDQHL
jgi:hypothetical protein